MQEGLLIPCSTDCLHPFKNCFYFRIDSSSLIFKAKVCVDFRAASNIGRLGVGD